MPFTAIQGGKRPSPIITWCDAEGNAEDLTGATITARIFNNTTGTDYTSDGTFTVTDAANGVFRWDYGDTDIGTAGQCDVQFTAAFGSGPTPARTRRTPWRVYEDI